MHCILAVAMHKQADVPHDPPYLPVQAGAVLQPPLGVTRDDTGENISARNPLYSELTAMYWLWKNASADALGLCHYRRYFRCRRGGSLLTGAQLDRLLADVDVIVPAPRVYLIETNQSHYAHAHRACDLDVTRQVVAEKEPAFLADYDRVMKRVWGRRFNMCIMRRAWFDRYCTWLFGILAEVEKRLPDMPERTLGHIAERLMDVWLLHEQPRMRELPVLHTEGQHWPVKIARFLMRKCTGGKK